LQRSHRTSHKTTLRIHGQKHEVKLIRETGFGPRFEVEGRLNAPDGRSPHIMPGSLPRSRYWVHHGV
jgi:hypothetical protein